MARRLYDLDWVEGGCVGPMPPDTDTDDTFGTYATNYLILAIGVGTAVALLLNPRPSQLYKRLAANFFIWTGIGYGIAGVLHQVFHEDEEHETHEVYWKMSFICVVFGSMFLGLIGNNIFVTKCTSAKKCLVCMDSIVLVVLGAVILMTAIGAPQLILIGVAQGVVLLYAIAVWGSTCSWVKVGGVFFMVAGLVLQVVLSPRCGDAAYPDCFKECPLPVNFNHNALFHLLFAIGLAILGVSMNVKPDLTSAETSPELPK